MEIVSNANGTNALQKCRCILYLYATVMIGQVQALNKIYSHFSFSIFDQHNPAWSNE